MNRQTEVMVAERDVDMRRAQLQHTDGGKWRGPRNPPKRRHFEHSQAYPEYMLG